MRLGIDANSSGAAQPDMAEEMGARMIKALTCAALCLGLALPAAAATVSGSAKVIDGDTLEIGTQRVRLFGIDAPEGTQTCDRSGERWACGQASADELRGMIGSGELICSGNEVDTYGRLLAVCTIGGVDLNRLMVSEGWATAFRRYSENYVPDENQARAFRRGLWSSSFMSPEDYRAAQRGDAPATPQKVSSARPRVVEQSTSSGCVIKGNRSRRGEWIYHVPSMPYYEQTRAEEMFCSESQAQAAGYRRAKVR